MPPRKPFNYDVSVAADKRRRARARGHTGKVATGERTCEWPGCDAAAQYRAPVSRDRLNEYRWFCLDHVREYNQSWNFFADFSEAEIDAQLRADRTWERPTWAFRNGAPGATAGAHADGRAWARNGFSDPLDVLGDNATQSPSPVADPMRPRRKRPLSAEEGRALDTLGLPRETESREVVRARYRELVKDLHPDMNGGNRDDETRLTRVLKAWDIIRGSRNFGE